MEELQKELADVKEKLAAAEKKEITLQDAMKVIKDREGVVFLSQSAYKDAVSKEKEKIVDALQKERRLITEMFASLGVEIPKEVPTDNEDGKSTIKDVLNFGKSKLEAKLATTKNTDSTKEEQNEKLLETEKALQTLKGELHEVKANAAKLAKDLQTKDEYSANLKKAMHEAKSSEIFNAAVSKELEKYTFTSESIKSLIKKEIEAELRKEFETEIDESGKLRVFEKYEYEGVKERVPSKDPSQSITTYMKGLEILKELTPKEKEKQEVVKATQKKVLSSNDKDFNPLLDGTETAQDQWLKDVRANRYAINSDEAVALKEKYGIITDAEKQHLKPKE